MMDYEGFWRGFIVLFGVLPFVIGGCGGAVLAWLAGYRKATSMMFAILGGAVLSIYVLAGAILIFRA